MAFPAVAERVPGTQGSDATTWTLNYPTTVDAGDLLVALIVTDLIPTITFPAGWQIVTAAASSGNSAKLHIAVKEADGTEDGGTFNITLDSSERGPWDVLRVTGWFGDSATWANSVVAATAVTGTVTNPDPPSLAPGWGAEDILWFAVTGYNSGTVTVTAYPTNYTDGVNPRVTTTSGGGLGYARRELNTASEDPGAFTLSGGQNTVAQTFAIRPAGGTVVFGASSATLAFSATTAATRTTLGSSTATINLGLTTAAFQTHFGSSTMTVNVNSVTVGTRKVFGASATTLNFGAATAGYMGHFGASSMSLVFNIVSSAGGVARGESSLTVNFGMVTSGKHTGVGSSSMTANFGLAAVAGRLVYGSSVLPIVLGFESQAVRATAGTSMMTVVFDITSLAFDGLVLLEAIYTGRVADTEVGMIDGREQGHVSDTVAGVVEEDEQEVLV